MHLLTIRLTTLVFVLPFPFKPIDDAFVTNQTRITI
nr:MAG TPA: hypothetical protein [Caudoviricetes sp.]